jgi:hypothetical protein
LLEWATYPDRYGYGNFQDPTIPDYVSGYVSRLSGQRMNFPLIYGPFMTDFTAVPRSSTSFVDIGWLSIALVIGVAVAVLYWRMDFK